MGGKSSAPPPPDYGPVAAASEKSAKIAAETAANQLAWAKEQYGMDKETTDKVVNSFLDTQTTNANTAGKDRARYERTFQPLEDQLAADAASYSSPERKDLEMGRSQAAVGAQFNQARNNASQQLMSYGVDPTSPRYAALNMGMASQEAAAAASAGNQASQYVDATGRALRSEAINVGKGYPGSIAGQYTSSLQAGSGAANTALAQTASGANTMGTSAQYMGLQNQALAGWGNTLHMGYQDQLGAFNAENSQSSGIGSILGAGLGMAAKFMDEGGTVDSEATPGGAIPVQASPSRGGVTDDVPAQLTAGEFVLPKDVMQWKGEEWAQKEIQKARVAKHGAVAKPAVGVARPQRPAFVSRPGQGALPMG